MDTGLKRRSIILMIALQIVTLGLYWPVWIFLTRRGLNNLHSETKVGVVVSTVMLVSQLSYIMLGGPMDPSMPGDVTGVNPGSALESAVTILAGVTCLILAFRVKHILEDHLSCRTSGRLSFVYTLVFGSFYFQHVINTRILAGVPRGAVPSSPGPQPTPIRADRGGVSLRMC